MRVLPYFTITCCRASGGLMFTALDFVLAFHWTKHSALNLPKLPLQGRNILRNFRQRGQPREVCPNLKQFPTGNFRSIWLFQPGIFVLIVSISKVQLISGFPETFPRSKSSRIFWLNEKRSLSTGPGSSPDQDYYIVFFILTVPLSTVPWCLNGFQRM